MIQVYDKSGYQWDDDDKMKELTEEGTRFLLVREKQLDFDDTPGRLIGFVHFRFTIEGLHHSQPINRCIINTKIINNNDKLITKLIGKFIS